MKDEILKEFDKEVLGYSMDIIGGYDGKSETIKRPIMCQREDARNFLIKALSARDEEWREKIEDCLDLIVGYQSDLCENSQEFRSLVVFELNEIIKDHRS